jgi:hypothetical protein
MTCDPQATAPSSAERAAAIEFERIDSEARTVCREDDEPNQSYSGTVGEVLKAVVAALREAHRIDERLELLRNARQTPRWAVATLARAGSIYDCVWNHLRQVQPVYFTAQQLALLSKIQGLAQQSPQGAAVQVQIDDTRDQLRNKWHEQNEKYLGLIAKELLRCYATAALLARRYGLEGFDLTRAHQRLPTIASILGDEAMSRLLADVPDPSDPEPDPAKRRRVVYVAGAFGVAP